MHRLQIRPVVHNLGASPTTSPSYIRVRAIVWTCSRGQTHTEPHRQTDTQTRVTTIHFASSSTHAKCNNHFDAHNHDSAWQWNVSVIGLMGLSHPFKSNLTPDRPIQHASQLLLFRQTVGGLYFPVYRCCRFYSAICPCSLFCSTFYVEIYRNSRRKQNPGC